MATSKRQQTKEMMECSPSNRGMIFNVEPPRVIEMWMKDVEAPLDIYFIRDGLVLSALKNVPLCENSPCNIFLSRECGYSD
ncbi:DUF192 domain-containing protein [Leptolyngbya sp. AN02str]|uniref:DUF192 domain-containing protein n=1 Tax=Leptolyngbya sp. AN02str TaxID=3423363 RepID=UPI003D32153D